MPNWKKVIVSGSSAHLNQITGSGGVKLPDQIRLNFGDANDLKIYHSGTHSIIQDTGTGNLEIKGSIVKLRGTAGGDSMGVFTEDGGVELYYDNSKKLDVVTGGVEVTGIIQASGNISGSASSTGSFGRVDAGAGKFTSPVPMTITTTTLKDPEGPPGGSGDNISFVTDNVQRMLISGLGGPEARVEVSASLHILESFFEMRGAEAVERITLDGTSNSPYIELFAAGATKVKIRSNGESYFNGGDVLFHAANAKISGSSTSTGSFGHLVIAKDAHIGEDLLADGDVVAYNSSDVRLKDNIQVIKGSLDKIDGIRGVEFDWNDKSPGWAQERGHDIGVIAQEVQKVIPEIVVERKNGYLGVDYKRLVPLLIESVKELRQEVNDLKKKVS